MNEEKKIIIELTNEECELLWRMMLISLSYLNEFRKFEHSQKFPNRITERSCHNLKQKLWEKIKA